MKKSAISTLALAALLLSACTSSSSTSVAKSSNSVEWNINSLTSIGGAPVSVMGNPQVVNSGLIKSCAGTAVAFDGDSDRLLVDANPLGDATEFTIEIIFNPADAYPNNLEPRFFHIESPDNPNRRITIELRLNDKKQWYLDAYIKSEKSQFTLIDATKVHPVGSWAHAAVTYKNREFISYVNGKQELIGQVDYLPIAANAKTSIGSRMNQVHWFNGEIAWVKITKKVLTPDEFLLLDKH
ncbi:LamG domain-containing protein [Cellvibrio sp. NN19]|uniref:LamG domain-containing protein n=1 Tax=Cellvibrio chitinivorans TaxID=3102792 RepID=UPI002B40FD2C|nr:LamG domain-containing protein [Cellvibrio sp. NN19]